MSSTTVTRTSLPPLSLVQTMARRFPLVILAAAPLRVLEAKFSKSPRFRVQTIRSSMRSVVSRKSSRLYRSLSRLHGKERVNTTTQVQASRFCRRSSAQMTTSLLPSVDPEKLFVGTLEPTPTALTLSQTQTTHLSAVPERPRKQPPSYPPC